MILSVYPPKPTNSHPGVDDCILFTLVGKSQMSHREEWSEITPSKDPDMS